MLTVRHTCRHALFLQEIPQRISARFVGILLALGVVRRGSAVAAPVIQDSGNMADIFCRVRLARASCGKHRLSAFSVNIPHSPEHQVKILRSVIFFPKLQFFQKCGFHYRKMTDVII